MRYIIKFRANGEKETHSQEFDSPESVVAFVQLLRLSQDGKTYPVENIKIIPIIPVKSLVFNKVTCETRVVKDVDYNLETLEVYNSDSFTDARKQECKFLSIIEETWNISDCIIVDARNLQRKGFFFGSRMGRHEKFQEMEIRSLGISY